MHIELTEEQTMLRDSVEKYLRDNYTFEQRQAVAKSEAGYSKEQWQTFAELGWLAMTLPEAHGGFDAGAVETMILCETMGRHLVLEPYLETVVLAGGLLESASESVAEKYLPGMAEGTVQGAFACFEAGAQSNIFHINTQAEPTGDGFRLNGSKAVVFNGPSADVLLVTARTSGEPASREGISLFVVDAEQKGIDCRSYKTYDGRHGCELTLEDVEVSHDAMVGEMGQAWPIIENVLQRALLALGAEAVGAMDALMTATVEYTKQRKQFGKPLSSFQVLRHRMADMYMQLELTRSLMLAAAQASAENDPQAPRLVAALKARVGKAGRFISHNAIQLHGGIGVTDELSVGHHFKRLAVIESLFGGTDYHLGRFKKLSS